MMDKLLDVVKRLMCDPVAAMESMPGVVAYRAFELDLGAVREKYKGEDSEEEDALLDRGDLLWWSVTDDERAYISTTNSPHYDYVVKWLKEEGE